ncbi:MAG: hypothetical protein AMJ76_02765 [Dehalococcoidia bacterium SM23_28_1]|nr:MAG: hypothetical protein AMJ76_02765 [Dehalococcoidia bacterium SM23_28_1]
MIGLIVFNRAVHHRLYAFDLTSVLVKPADTYRQGKELAVVPQEVCLELVFLAVSGIVDNLLERTGRACLTRQCSCMTATVHKPRRVNPIQHMFAGRNDPLVAQSVLKPSVDEEFVALSGGSLEEQRR